MKQGIINWNLSKNIFLLTQLLGLLLLPVVIFAQRDLSGILKITNPEDYHSSIMNISSPTASGLTNISSYDVDLFNGALSLSLPLLNVSHGSIDVPISLSYSGNGIRVDQYSGWVGLGWNLLAGGVITRHTNDLADEYYNRSPYLATGALGRDAGYYFLGKTLDKDNWSTTDYLRSKITFSDLTMSDSMVDLEPDEFIFSFGGYTGSFFRSEKGEWKIKSKQNITLEVEEELDNSGTFRLWRRFLPSGGDSMVILSPYYEEVGSLFTKFTITTPDGFKYVFGEDSLAIEFSRGPVPVAVNTLDLKKNYITANSWYLSQIISPQKDTIKFEYKQARVLYKKFITRPPIIFDDLGDAYSIPPHSLSGIAINQTFLKAIHTPNIRVDFFVNESQELSMTNVNWISEPPALDTDNIWEDDVSKILKARLCRNWNDLGYESDATAYHFLPTNMRKLDSIKVFEKQKGEYVNGVKLYYKQDENVRKTLDSLELYDFVHGVSGGTYQFEYNHVESMPPYESAGKDHWGFLNEPSYTNIVTNYSNSNKEPSSNYGLYGLIEKITYPTGGYSTFEFEPAYYNDYIRIDPNDSEPVKLSSYSTAKHAGVRIKSVTDHDIYGGNPLTTSYFYTKNFISGGTYSSGVLGMLPRYSDSVIYVNDAGDGYLSSCGGTFFGKNVYHEASEWLQQFRGGIVNYSEVAVKYPDGSTKVTYFSNSDKPEYRDEIHANYAAFQPGDGFYVSMNANFRIISNDLERGNILKERIYNSGNEKVKEQRFYYLNDPLRKNQFVKAVAIKLLSSLGGTCTPAWGTMGGPRIWAYKIYTYKNPLSSMEEVEYFGLDSLVVKANVIYDQYGNLTQSRTTGSDGYIYINNYKYNSHPDFNSAATSAEALGIRKLYNDLGIKNQLVEQNTIVTDMSIFRVLGAKLYTYSNTHLTRLDKVSAFELSSAMPLPAGITEYQTARIMAGDLDIHPNFKVQTSYLDYTKYGIPGTIRGTAEATALTVDNRSRHVSSVVVNAENDDVAYSNFEGNYSDETNDENKGNWIFNPTMITTNSTAPMGKNCYILRSLSGVGGGTQSEIITKNILKSGKSYVISFWIPEISGAAPLPILSATSMTFIAPELKKTTNGWSYYEGTIVGNGEALRIYVPFSTSGVSVSRQTYIDELRLYPASSAMSSFVRDPYSGQVLSICDQSSNIKHFELDGFGRLETVRDEFRYIEQFIQYKFQVNN